ncbi:hypothetical protein DL89DRAFT_119413 [Linderina pennispora]|uniref:Uncharacterized protein n=1 Tax=Linderina pennispora TaxID=61395 RepID=A0A1Y1VVF0_9FUNG|nr:uncharacterized protein DL89DRAFT_119413 [Linderina pennispora]ORX65262.1 hypothetical protein DL89DRAFT_119413 [Linderina pennispora]
MFYSTARLHGSLRDDPLFVEHSRLSKKAPWSVACSSGVFLRASAPCFRCVESDVGKRSGNLWCLSALIIYAQPVLEDWEHRGESQ